MIKENLCLMDVFFRNVLFLFKTHFLLTSHISTVMMSFCDVTFGFLLSFTVPLFCFFVSVSLALVFFCGCRCLLAGDFCIRQMSLHVQEEGRRVGRARQTT